MQKLKNLSLVSSTSKLYIEKTDSHIFLKLQNSLHSTAKKNNNIQDIMKKKTEDENKIVSNRGLTLYKPLVLNVEISKFLTTIPENFSFNSVALCPSCNRFPMEENKNCTAVGCRLYNSRAIIPYINKLPNNVNPTKKFKSTINFSLDYIPKNSEISNQKIPVTKVDDYIGINPSKFALRLSEIWEEMKEVELQDFPLKSNVTIKISRNCKSCPAVVSIKQFQSKCSPKRTESKVLLLSCENFSKFEETFTKLLAKNKIRNIQPLLQKMENKEHVLTKLERAFINHNLRINKNKDMLKRNVIVLKPKVMENIKESLDSKDDNEKFNTTENMSTCNFNNMNSKTSNVHMGRTPKPSNIMIVNNKIFKDSVENKGCSYIQEEKNNLLYLNNTIFKELKKENVNKILSRTYTNRKESENEIVVMIPTRKSSKKLKPLILTDKKDEEYQEVPLKNLISAVADKKRLEYVERSKINWKVFEKFEKTMEKVKILNFPPPADIQKPERKQIDDNERKRSEISKTITQHQERTLQERGESKFLESPKEIRRIDSSYKRGTIRPKITTKTKKVKEKRINSPHKTIAMKEVEPFKIHPHRITFSQSMEKEQIKSSKKGRNKSPSPNTKMVLDRESDRSKKEKTTSKTKRPEKTFHSIVKICESKKKSKMNDGKNIKSNKNKDSNEGIFKQREEVRVVKINKLALGKTMETAEEYNNPEKKECKESSLFQKHHGQTKIKSKNDETSKISRTKNVSTNKNYNSKLENLMKKTKKTSVEENNPEKEKIMNDNENSNPSFEEQKNRPFREEVRKDDSIIFIHKAPMKSKLSSSHFEISKDLVIKPKRKDEKQVKADNVPLKPKITSKVPEDEKENILIVEKPIGSIHSAKIVKTKKSANRKIKTQLPILGTPTSITKQIEKIAVTALETNVIKENEEVVGGNMNNSVLDTPINRRKQKKLKPTELEEIASDEARKDKYESEEINNFQKKLEKMKNDARSLLKMEKEKKGRENRLDIDEILAMSSPSLAKRVNDNSSKKLSNEDDSLNEDFKKERFNEMKISEDITQKINTTEDITNLPTKQLTDKSSSVSQNFNIKESQHKELKNKIVNMNNNEQFLMNNSQNDFFKGSMDEINDEVESMKRGDESVENKLEYEIFNQRENDESAQKFKSNKIKYNTDSEVTEQNDFTKSIGNKTETLFNENKSSITMQQSKIKKNILEEKLENDILANGSPDGVREVIRSKEQLTKKVETEEKENILRFLQYEEEKHTVEKANDLDESESDVIIYKTKTQVEEGKEYLDNIHNRPTAIILDRDDKKSISSVGIIASYKKEQKDNPGCQLRTSESTENDSHEQFIIFRGVQQNPPFKDKIKGENINRTKNEENCTSENGESTTKTEDTFRNNEKHEIIENKSFFTQEKKSTIKLSNQSSLDKTAKFSTSIKNEMLEKDNSLEEKSNRNASENFIETYFSENNIEDFEIFKTNPNHKKTEISDEKGEQTTKLDTLTNKTNEMNQKSTDDTLSTEDPEVIRKKRLIYFWNYMKIKGQVEITQFENDSGSAQQESISMKNKKDSLQPERSIESSSQTSAIEKDLENSMIQTDQVTEIKPPKENKEGGGKQSSFSQYDIQPFTGCSEKAIETETDHKDAAVIAKTESLHNGTKHIENHKILKQSVSDNVIILKAARTDSVETVESVDGITKSFLKRVQSKMNIVQNSKLKTNTMQKCRDIIIKLKKSQEKIVRNIPSNIYKIYQEARKIKSKLSRTKILKKKSGEIVSKFTNTSKNTVDTANQAAGKGSSISSYKRESKVRSVIERKVTSRIKFLTKSPIRTKKKKRNMTNLKPKSNEGTETIRSSPSFSLAELRNKSIGSLFADTVASALAHCGNVNQIMSKYSESVDKIPSNSESNGNFKQSQDVGNFIDLIEEPGKVQKEDEFLMNDGIRKLVLTASVIRNADCASDDEWKCCPKAVLIKKTSGERENHSGLKPSDKYIKTNDVLSSSNQNKKHPYFFSSPLDNVCESSRFFNDIHEESEKTVPSSTHLDDEVNALEETKQDLTKLKMLLQEEKEKTLNSSINNEEDKVLIKNNEIFNMKIPREENDTPKSLEDLHKDLVSARDSRNADGSTSPPPNDLTDFSFQDMNSCESFQGQPIDCSENGGSLTDIGSTAHLKEIDVIPVCLTGTESREINSPEIFVTPLTSNTDFKEDSGSLSHSGISNPRLSPLLNEQEIDKDQCDQLKSTKTSNESYVNDGERNLNRKDEIKLSSEFSDYSNSLIRSEENKRAIKRSLDNREASEARIDNVLEETQENRNEIFIDLKRMGNGTLKTNPSKDKVSIEEPARSRNPNLKNNSRSFATDNPYGSYSRFKEPANAKNNESKKEKCDLEELDKLHDEALDDEIFFGRKIKRRKKDLNENMICTPRRSIYDEIVRRSESIETEIEEPEERHIPVKGDKDVSGNQKKILLDKRNINDTVVIPTSPDHNKNQPVALNSEDCTGKQANDTCQEEASDVIEVFNYIETSQNEPEVSENEEKRQTNTEKENNEVVFQSAEVCREGYIEKTENEELKVEDIREGQKQIETSSDGKKHKILKKFAQISQEQSSGVFRINNDVKFDLNKKRMCQTENKYAKPKRCISQGPNQVNEENKEKPLMIIKLSPSRELYKPPVPKMSDTDLKNMLVKNPKMLMRIASDIMSKNQYLSFLLDLKSTKELKEYWMNKIKDGIVSSKSFRDLARVMDYFKVKSVKDAENEDEKDFAEKKSDTPLVSQHKSENEPTGPLSSKSSTVLNENKTNQHGETIEPRAKTSSSKNEPTGLLSSKSDTGFNENKKTEEKGELRTETRQSSPCSLGRTMLKRDHEQGKSSKRNLRLEHKNQEECEPLPYTLEKYLKSPDQTVSQLIDNKSINSPRISKNLHGKEIEMEIAHQNLNFKNEIKSGMGENGVEDTILPMERRVGKYLFKLSEEKPLSVSNKQKPCKKIDMMKNRNSKINENIENDQNRGNNWDGIFYLKKTKSEDYLVKKINPQQTAIVLPGREPIKISLISNEPSASPVASIKDNSEKNVLENLSDVLSNCSSPVSSLNSRQGKPMPKKRLMKKVGFKKTGNIEMQQSKTPSSNISSTCLQKQPIKAPADLNPNSLRLKKFDNPLKEFVRNHEDFQPSTNKNHVVKKEDTNVLPMSLYEERPVIRTKSLSEVLKEDPDFLKKIRERKMLEANKDDEAARRFEYRFHDFRRKEDKNLVMKVKRQEEQKRDLITKFKCLIQARKVATERNRQSIRSNENQQIQPKVFSKILEKISYFKELENQPKNEMHVDTVLTEKGEVPTKRGVDPRSPRAANGNRRMLHTKRKQINEDELVTWVQEHPAVPEKRVAMENLKNCEEEKQNVIHIPWTPTNLQEDT